MTFEGGACPRCGAPTLFKGVISFADRCRACGLDYSAYNVGDGPAAFLTMIIGALVVAGAMTLEFSVHPPFWVHILLWVPLTIIASIFGLRVSKAWLITAEHRRQAREGRLSKPTPADGGPRKDVR